jgi:hypothetical protein
MRPRADLTQSVIPGNHLSSKVTNVLTKLINGPGMADQLKRRFPDFLDSLSLAGFRPPDDLRTVPRLRTYLSSLEATVGME